MKDIEEDLVKDLVSKLVMRNKEEPIFLARTTGQMLMLRQGRAEWKGEMAVSAWNMQVSEVPHHLNSYYLYICYNDLQNFYSKFMIQIENLLLSTCGCVFL